MTLALLAPLFLLACPGNGGDEKARDTGPGDAGSPAADSADTADSAPPPDADGDGWPDAEDCAPADPAVSPGATEACNGIDDDCDGETDEGLLVAAFADADGDGHGAAAVEACPVAAGTSELGDDCDDAEPLAFPGNTEICDDGVDNDCDGGSNDCRWSGSHDLDDAGAWIAAESDGDYAAATMAANAGLGDVDGDGIDDFAVGAEGYGPVDVPGDRGAVFVVLGSAAGLPGDLGGAWAKVEGAVDYAEFGTRLAGLGDVDGDGLGDLAATSPGEWQLGAEAFYILRGLGAGTSAVRSTAAARFEADPDHEGGVTWLAPGAADITGDGSPDVVATFLDTSGSGVGRYEVFACDATASGELFYPDCTWILPADESGLQHGMAFDASADLDGDGLLDLVTGEPLDCGGEAACDWTSAPGAVLMFSGPVAESTSWSAYTAKLLGEGPGDAVGDRVTVAADTNGDGYADLVVGVSWWDDAHSTSNSAGAIYWVEGPLSGSASLADARARVTGEAPTDGVGFYTALVGDTDGDGRADVAAAATLESNDNASTVHVLYGPGEPGLLAEAGPQFSTARDNSIGFPAGLGDVDGDGLVDLGLGLSVDSAGWSETPAGGLHVLLGAGI